MYNNRKINSCSLYLYILLMNLKTFTTLYVVSTVVNYKYNKY